ncbi:PEP-CTERM motif protein [Botrimarina colliarenosi]|uniref:PEP-CTERM motif protein n=1 Tax=Botrimarina colliarenosi TaxID=2528001 RepID=A0A5C6A0Z1_9BACT|nr:PEP-CTERM sorting domain-containing protein [Botrimarina colliarenosi]TWT92911.1 PEP-CTERM motif protein [Botrimarina colliarenosi]
MTTPSHVFCIGRVALALAIGTAVSASAADTTLFTTQEDFTGWNDSVQQASPDLDGSSTNGLAEGGGPGTPGSLLVIPGSGFMYISSDGQQDNVALVSALGTGGVIQFDHQIPAEAAASYFQLGALFNYDGHFDQYFGTTVDNLDGTFTTSVPFDFSPGDLASYLQIGLIYNAGFSGVSFTVDNVRIAGPAIPEPTSTAIAAIGLAGLGMMRRRRR